MCHDIDGSFDCATVLHFHVATTTIIMRPAGRRALTQQPAACHPSQCAYACTSLSVQWSRCVPRGLGCASSLCLPARLHLGPLELPALASSRCHRRGGGLIRLPVAACKQQCQQRGSPMGRRHRPRTAIQPLSHLKCARRLRQVVQEFHAPTAARRIRRGVGGHYLGGSTKSTRSCRLGTEKADRSRGLRFGSCAPRSGLSLLFALRAVRG